MAYIVKGPVYGTFQKQSFAVNGSETEFSLGNKVSGATSLLVVSNGEIIEPNVAYSVINGGTKIKFVVAPSNPTYAIFLGKQFLVPSEQGYETALEQFVGDGVKTTFTLTSNPVVNSGLIVFVDGIQQTYGLGKNFTLSGLDIIFTSPPANGVEIDVYVIARERIGIDVPSDGVITRPKLNDNIKHSVGIWRNINSSQSVVDGEWYFVDTSVSPVVLTLPVFPYTGQTVKYFDTSGTFGANSLTFNGNGKKINGISGNLVITTNGSSGALTFTGEDRGWVENTTTNIKTINGESVLGSGDITISSGLAAASTAEAQAGTSNTVAITPLRLREGLNASGSAPIYACRAWVNFNGTTTPGTIRASGNVSSVTNSGSAIYVINFTTAMPDADYVLAGNSAQTGVGGGNSVVNPNSNGANHLTTSATIQVHNFSAGVASPQIQIAIFR